jgi:hypothetical protein
MQLHCSGEYPQAQDVEDPNDARFVSLTDLKHWEMAPTNPGAFEKAGIPFSPLRICAI